ncbi:MAG: tol-pal system protein YbgF [Deltaproteobacteria bacterium]|nr:tol-pal system protein YbgF [Deltaproteobacteria bacterium]
MRWIVFLFFISLSLSAWADNLPDRVGLLEKQVVEIQRVVETNNKNVAEALLSFSQIRGEFQALKGALEENRHFFELYKTDSSRLMEDIDHRISGLEDRFSLLASQMNELLEKGPPTTKAAVKNEEGASTLYNKGLTFVNNRSYKEAINTFGQFIQQYPKSDLANNAQYWIGESYFAMRDFKTAIAEFQKVVEKYPNSLKVASAILKQGFSFYEMKSYPEAEAFLKKVIAKYPKSTEAGKAEERLKKL